MKKTILFFLFLISFSLKAQNPADVDLAVGTGYVGFHKGDVIAVQPDGKIIVGGYFQLTPGGSTGGESRLARYNTNGSIDTSFHALPLAGQSASISEIIVQPDGKILVAGSFSTVGGVNAGGIVRLNSDGSRDTTFSVPVSIVNCAALQPDGKIIIGGVFFLTVNGHLQKNVIRLNTDGTVDNTFDFGSLGFGPINYANTVMTVAIQPDGKILAGGVFTAFDGVAQGKLIRFNANGTKDTTFNIGTGSTDSGILNNIIIQSDGKIIISGGFGSWNGQPYGHLCRLNTDGTIDTPFITVFNSITSSFSDIILQSDGKIIGVGNISINGQAHGINRINTDGSLDATFTPVDNTIPRCVTLQDDGKILIGGGSEGIIKNGIARLNAIGTLDTSFNQSTGLNAAVNTIALLTNNRTLLAGDFTLFNGDSQNKIIAINNDGTKDNSFSIGTGFNNAVRTMAVQPDGKIVVGGDFTLFNEQTSNYIIRLNTDGTKDTTFSTGIGFNNGVKAITIQSDGKILIGGNFTEFNGLSQNHLIRLNANGAKDDGFLDTAFNNAINTIKLQTDGKIIAGGDFSSFNNLPQNRIIRLNTDGSKDSAFMVPTTINYSVKDIEIQADGKLIIAFGYLCRLNTNGSLDTSFTNPSFFGVNTVALQSDGKILVGGSFYLIGNQYQNRIIRLNTNGTKDTSFDIGINGTIGIYIGGFTEGECKDIVVQPDDKIWVGGSFFHYRGTTSFSAIRLAGENILSTADFEINKDKILFYPNPVNDILHISETAKEIKIIDVLGRVIATKNNTNEIDFSNHPQGLYFITAELENGIKETTKIIKKG